MHENNDKPKIEGDKERRVSSVNEFNKLFDRDFWLEPFDFWRRSPRMFGRAFGMGPFPRVDVSETDTDIKVTAEVPGMDPDKIDIDVHGDVLRIRGSVEEEKMIGEKPYRYERAYGEFQREFTLPTRVKESEIKAVCKNGVLTITLPKVEEDKRKKVRIEKQ